MGRCDSHYKRHYRPSPQRAKEIAQNEDGPRGGGMGEMVRWRGGGHTLHNAGSLGH